MKGIAVRPKYEAAKIVAGMEHRWCDVRSSKSLRGSQALSWVGSIPTRPRKSFRYTLYKHDKRPIISRRIFISYFLSRKLAKVELDKRGARLARPVRRVSAAGEELLLEHYSGLSERPQATNL